ncbi:MAG TPA: phosphoglycerate kinase [Candidatus Bathyarchaeia archaeon]|nr:phosphoglycerate kinase [Candidatus Bathyarchaeia archaeon]
MGEESRLSLEQVDLEGKRVFLRADFNVPLAGDVILDDARLRAAIPTLRYCQGKGAGIVLASHLGRPEGRRDPTCSLKPVAFRLEELLGEVVPLAPDCVGPLCERLAGGLAPGQLLLLENLRFHEEEEANDARFAQSLARLADCYVNDAFSASHRQHASLVAITRFLQPAVAGLLMQRELAALERLTESPKRPVVIVLGGARVSEKLGLIRRLLQKADRLLIGGAMAFTFLRALGHVTGQSLVEQKLIPAAKEILAEAAARHVEVLLPEDLVVSTYPGDQVSVRVNPVGGIGLAMMGLDIGPRTLARFRAALQDAGTIVWNGPMGMCRIARFATGTREMAQAIAECRGLTVAGGGDTVAAIAKAGVAAKFGYLSMAGAAFLEYLEGRELPGVAALTEGKPVRSGAGHR